MPHKLAGNNSGDQVEVASVFPLDGLFSVKTHSPGTFPTADDLMLLFRILIQLNNTERYHINQTLKQESGYFKR